MIFYFSNNKKFEVWGNITAIKENASLDIKMDENKQDSSSKFFENKPADLIILDASIIQCSLCSVRKQSSSNETMADE